MLQYRGNSKKGEHVEITRRKKNIMRRVTIADKVDEIFVASSKAKNDVRQIFLDYGYQSIADFDKCGKKIVGKLWLSFQTIQKAKRKLHDEDVLIMAYPSIIIPSILKVKKKKNVKIILLIMDLNGFAPDQLKAEVELLNKADVIISHNIHMSDKLREFGCTAGIVELEIFDYLLKDLPAEKNYVKGEKIQVDWPGRISDSRTGFIRKVEKMNTNYVLNLYGPTEDQFENSVVYKGCFEPDELPWKLEGQFGMIWQGMDLKPNVTEWDYFRYNNPHKTSLFSVCCRPIIIWSGAAMADFVQKYDIGIVVDDLSNLDEILNSITEERYNMMKSNMKAVQIKLASGEFTKEAIRKAEKLLGIEA